MIPDAPAHANFPEQLPQPTSASNGVVGVFPQTSIPGGKHLEHDGTNDSDGCGLGMFDGLLLEESDGTKLEVGSDDGNELNVGSDEGWLEG